MHAPPGKLPQIDLPPGELPVGEVLPAGHGTPAIQQVAQKENALGVGGLPVPRDGEVRVGEREAVPHQCDGKLSVGKGQAAARGHLSRVPGLEFLQIVGQRQLLLVVFPIDGLHRAPLCKRFHNHSHIMT